VKGKHLAIGFLVALFGVVSLVFWFGATGERPATSPGATRDGHVPTSPVHEDPGQPASGASYDGGAIAQTVADRRVRDELRRRIFAGWAQDEGEKGAAARTGKVPPMPQSSDGQVDPTYIQSVIRQDMLPMATRCYEEMLSRKPDAGGRLELVFKIVGDDSLGGIIEEAEIDGGIAGALGDARMESCIRESLLSLAFRPPPNDGWVTVTYPLELASDDRDD